MALDITAKVSHLHNVKTVHNNLNSQTINIDKLSRKANPGFWLFIQNIFWLPKKYLQRTLCQF